MLRKEKRKGFGSSRVRNGADIANRVHMKLMTRNVYGTLICNCVTLAAFSNIGGFLGLVRTEVWLVGHNKVGKT